MGDKTIIAWTDHTQNFWMGCSAVSPGCEKCYMFAAQERYGRDPFRVTRTGGSIWKQPARWNAEARAEGKRHRVFTCSWSDFFHRDADAWRGDAWDIIKRTPYLDYQILTKRPGRIREHLPVDWGTGYPNVWLGVSVESREWLWRLNTLREIPATVRFVSFEPLLESVAPMNLAGIHWAIVGGESGPGFRPMDHQWAREIRDASRASGTAFFFKQSAAARTEMGIALLEADGSSRVIREYPLSHSVAAVNIPTPIIAPSPSLF